MVTLYQMPPAWGLPNVSPFCFVLWPPPPSPMKDHAATKPNLVAYAARMKKRYYDAVETA